MFFLETGALGSIFPLENRGFCSGEACQHSFGLWLGFLAACRFHPSVAFTAFSGASSGVLEVFVLLLSKVSPCFHWMISLVQTTQKDFQFFFVVFIIQVEGFFFGNLLVCHPCAGRVSSVAPPTMQPSQPFAPLGSPHVSLVFIPSALSELPELRAPVPADPFGSAPFVGRSFGWILLLRLIRDRFHQDLGRSFRRCRPFAFHTRPLSPPLEESWAPCPA